MMKITPKDLEYFAARRFSVDAVARALRVPPDLLLDAPAPRYDIPGVMRALFVDECGPLSGSLMRAIGIGKKPGPSYTPPTVRKFFPPRWSKSTDQSTNPRQDPRR